jgi:Zn-dependent protease with chaperone function
MSAATRTGPRIRILPAWLWFWLGLYVLNLPTQFRTSWQPALADLLAASAQPGEMLIPFSVFFRLANLAELAPLLLVGLGATSVLLPWLRARQLERRYNLGQPSDLPILQEMRDFLAGWAPELEIRANLLRTDQLAFVYPVGYRRSAVAIFGGLVRLWRRDPRAGKAILLHEVAHYRQGDTLVLGSGSFFESLLRSWLPIFLGLVFLPLTLVWGYEAVRFVLAPAVAGSLSQTLLYKLVQLGTLYLPGLLFIFTGLLFWTLSVLILPLAGVWSAELNADHFAIQGAEAESALRIGLDLLHVELSGSGGWFANTWRWLLAGMTHPPAGLRRRLAFSYGPDATPLALILWFPLAFTLRPFLLVGRALTGLILIGSGPPQSIALNLLASLRNYWRGATSLLVAMAVYVAFWPLLAALWGWFFCHLPIRVAWGKSGRLLASAALIGGLAVGAFWLGRPQPVGLENPRIDWQAGQRVSVEWQGGWYPAEILQQEAGRYLVHYLGYDSSWDEWVEPSRIRPYPP